MISFGPPQCAWCGSKGSLWIASENFILFFCNKECLHEWELLFHDGKSPFKIIRLDETGLKEMFLQYDQQFKRIITAPERSSLELRLSELNYWKWGIETLICDNLGIFDSTERSRFIEKQKVIFWKEEQRLLEANYGKKES